MQNPIDKVAIQIAVLESLRGRILYLAHLPPITEHPGSV